MAKKKVKKRDFSKTKEKAIKALKIFAKALMAIVGIIVTVAFIVIPFLHNKIDATVARFIWYPSCLLFVISAIANMVQKPKQPVKYLIFDFIGNLGIVPIIIILGSAFVINYYDTGYTWFWAIFVLVLLYIPVFTFEMRNFLKKEKEYTEDQIKTSLKVCWKYVCFYWVIDLFYMSIFNYWIADEQAQKNWLAVQFVFGGLAMVYIFYNLARAFLSNTKKQWWGLLQDFLWGIAITVYLIFLIPDDALQNIVLTITAAVYGGLLTLVGVAWTIKDTNEKRKEDLIRVENERNEEERKKHIPFIKIISIDKADDIIGTYISNYVEFDNEIDIASLTNNVFYSVNIKDFVIKNISSSLLTVKGIIICDKYHDFSREKIIEQGATCTVQITRNWSFSFASLTDKLHLIIYDALGNEYAVECHINHHTDSSMHMKCTTKKGVELTGFSYTYVIDVAGIPKLISKN